MHLVVYCNIMNSTNFWQNSSVGGAQWCKQSSGKSLRREEEQSLQWRVMQVILLSRQGRTGAVWKSAEWRLIFTLCSFSLRMHSLNCFSTPPLTHFVPRTLCQFFCYSLELYRQPPPNKWRYLAFFLCEQANSTLRWHLQVEGGRFCLAQRKRRQHNKKVAFKTRHTMCC